MSPKVGGAKASRIGALGFTFLALVLTALTALLLARMMGSSKYANEPVQDVVVAATNINPSSQIRESNLRVAKWPQSAIPEGSFKSLDEILGPEIRVPISTIFKDEVILKQRLANPDKGTGMAAQVDKGLRAFPIPVDTWIAEARLVYPGAVVDVLTTIKDTTNRMVSTKLVLQRVRVLALNGEVDAAVLDANNADNKKKNSGRTQKSVVTLLVTADQAEMLALASREGRIDLMLRNARDPGMVETLGVTARDLLGQADPEEVAAALADEAANEKAAAANRRRPSRRHHRRPKPGDDDSNEGPRVIRRGGTKTVIIGGK